VAVVGHRLIQLSVRLPGILLHRQKGPSLAITGHHTVDGDNNTSGRIELLNPNNESGTVSIPAIDITVLHDQTLNTVSSTPVIAFWTFLFMVFYSCKTPMAVVLSAWFANHYT